MIYLIAAIFFNAVMIFAMKLSETKKCARSSVTFINYIAGIAVSILTLRNKQQIFSMDSGWFTIGLGIFNAVCMTGCLMLYQYSIRRNGAPMSTTFNRLGVLIPTVLSALFFKEYPRPIQIAGIIAAAAAIIYINEKTVSTSDKTANKGISKSVPILIGLFVIGGLIDFNSKVFNTLGDRNFQDKFVLYTFVFSAVISGCIVFFQRSRITGQEIFWGLCIGIPNTLMTFFVVKASAVLPAYLAFPAYSAAVIFIVNIVNAVVFKEKLSPREIRATLLIAVALVLINL